MLCAPVNTVSEGMQDPQVAARQMLLDIPHPTRGNLKSVAPPLKLLGAGPTPRQAAPAMRADTEAVLKAVLGLDAAGVARLREQGAI